MQRFVLAKQIETDNSWKMLEVSTASPLFEFLEVTWLGIYMNLSPDSCTQSPFQERVIELDIRLQ